LSFQELANPRWFDEDPALAWAFYGHRLHLYRQTVPHRGFSMLLEEATKKRSFFIFTSNVDGQFQKAGFAEKNIMECHGSIHHLQCTRCNSGIIPAENIKIPLDMESFRALDWPLCRNCKAVMRPNILMFGDWRWDSSRMLEQERRFENFVNRIRHEKMKLVIVEIGAGTAIPTVRLTGERTARKYNGTIVRINPRETEIDPSLGISIPLGGLRGIEALLST
jgi:NAD-dependent SIR2 family protein deacetylase